MKKIVINKGDEYRAKIEEEYRIESVFYDVFVRAERCVQEIVSETNDYLRRLEQKNERDELFRGYGNNIVAFCGERGAGKTSTMVSVAAQLKLKYNYEVLDPIDPTMLTGVNSIILVFLSYLFKKIERMSEDMSGITDRSRTAEQGELMQCIAKCYKNLNYVRGTALDSDEGDLEYIGQLGDSTELRKNLSNLVNLYLKYCSGKKKEDKGHLIVQIDDTDLAVDDAFQICEDIRKFLKFPNVIVFMATDYDQLWRVVYQKNSERFAMNIQNKAMSTEEDLQEITSRYLEKMIPKGHRIDLPRLDWMMQTLPGQLELEYKVENQTEKRAEKQEEKQKELDELFSGCRDIQEQLIKFLYTKTGIILMKNNQTINSFLPHTMRELTHFVKMLYDMETVDVNKVYTNLSSPDEENCEKLKKNLVEIREYFLENWCSEWLSVNQHKLLKEINEKSIKHDFAGLSRVFSKYMEKGKDVGKKITYRHIITGVLGENGIADLVLQNAVSLYFTIFLNEWFAEAVMNSAQFEQLAEFLDYSVEIPQKVGNRRFRGRYEVMRFEISLEKLRSYIPESIIDENTESWFKLFCRAVGDDEGQPVMEHLTGEKNVPTVWMWNEDVATVQFDILHPLTCAIGDSTMRSRLSEDDESGIDKESRNSSGLAEPPLIQPAKNLSTFLCIKNIVANYELQMSIMECLEHDYRYFARKKLDISWGSIVEELYGNIDKYYQKAVKGLGIPGELKQRLMEFFDNKILYLTFLANEGNLNAYIDEYVQNLKLTINDVQKKINQIAEDKDNAKAENLYEIEFSVNNLAPRIINLNVGTIPNKQVKKLQAMDSDFQEKFDGVLSSASDFDSVFGELEEIVSEMGEKVSKLDNPKQTGKRESKRNRGGEQEEADEGAAG